MCNLRIENLADCPEYDVGEVPLTRVEYFITRAHPGTIPMFGAIPLTLDLSLSMGHLSTSLPKSIQSY